MTDLLYKTTTFSFESRRQRTPTEHKIICQDIEPPKLAHAQTLFSSVGLAPRLEVLLTGSSFSYFPVSQVFRLLMRKFSENEQSRSQSLRSPCPAERETRDSGIKRFPITGFLK